MKILNTKRGLRSIKLFGKILGESGRVYSFGYIRNPEFRGWVCTCEDFLYRGIPNTRNCKHLRFIRKQFGRYGINRKYCLTID